MGHGHNVNDKHKRLYSFHRFEGLNTPNASFIDSSSQVNGEAYRIQDQGQLVWIIQGEGVYFSPSDLFPFVAFSHMTSARSSG